jgi:4-alpha-glucanotransferase
MWDKWMATIRAALEEPERLGPERDGAWREVRRLSAWAGFFVPDIRRFEEVHEPLLAGLLRCNSWLAVVMITDLLGTAERFNVPGSVGEENWSARLPAKWERTFEEKVWRISRLIRESGR